MSQLAYKSPTVLQSTMKHFKCSAYEAQLWLSTPINNAFLFSSGEVYTPPSWNKS